MADGFTPPRLLRNAHLQTLAPAWFGRSPALASGEDLQFTAPDGEPLLGAAHWQPGPRDAAATALLLHGIEGDAAAPYMRRLTSKLLRRGWHVVRLDLRGCGRGEPLTPTLLHGGRGDDIAAVLVALAREAPRLAAIGCSLGGALLLRMLGEGGAPPGFLGGVAISPPLNPAAIQVHLDRRGGAVYRRYFLATMARRLRRRARWFPAHFPDHDFRCASMRDFDERVTAPLAGFTGADDYYRRADALPLLAGVAAPTLLLHAQDDPMVPFAGFAAEVTRVCAGHPHLRAEFPRHGGHLGFYDPTRPGDPHWAEDRALVFLEQLRAARP